MRIKVSLAVVFVVVFAGASTSVAVSPDELFKRGVEAHQRSDLSQAASYYEQVLAIQPDVFEAIYNLGLAYAGLGRYEEALRTLQRAQSLQGDDTDVLGSIAALKVLMMDYVGAERDARRLLQRDPNSQSARFTLAHVSIERREFAEAEEQLGEILEREPGRVDALYMRAVVALQRKQADIAKLYVEEALRVDPKHEGARRLSAELASTDGSPEFARLWRWVVGAGEVLVACLALVFIVGAPLSLMQVRASGRVRRAFDRTWAERVIKTIYAGILAFAVLLFYVSIPVLVVTVLMLGGGVLYGMLSSHRVNVQLVLVILGGTLGATYVLIQSLFFRAPTGAFGVPKTSQEEPRLYALLNEVASSVGTKPVDIVYMGPTSDIGVSEQGEIFRAVAGRARRVLTLGIATLPLLSVQELQAILAHEYGHYSNRDTAVSAVTYRVMHSMGSMIAGMAEQGRITWVNPAFWFLFCFHWVFLVIARGRSRTQELFADRVAAALYGPTAFVSGLEKVAVEGSLFDSIAESWVVKALQDQRQFRNIFETYAERRPQFEAKMVEDHRSAVVNRERRQYDSHPALPIRAAAVQGIPEPALGDRQPVRTLFQDFATLQEEVTTFLTRYVSLLISVRGVTLGAEGSSSVSGPE